LGHFTCNQLVILSVTWLSDTHLVIPLLGSLNLVVPSLSVVNTLILKTPACEYFNKNELYICVYNSTSASIIFMCQVVLPVV